MATSAAVLTVSQLTQEIKRHLEGSFPSVWIEGEISNAKMQSSGHFYFSLKDSKAQIAAVMFRGDMLELKSAPKDGDHVIVRGEMNVYPPSGRYQLVIRELRQVGLGELLLKLEELKKKIHQKGWFKAEHKKPLPKFPKRIGVVTSPTGAVIQDIINVLSRRFSGFHLILNPVRVQGEGAAQEIAQAIQQFNQHQLVDVMIVGRGGGSLEDLWAFNEEIVAAAIFHSQIPIVSAVGHETDHCIADYVADVRAPTPSAAAEIVSAETAQQLQHLQQLQRRMQQTVNHLIRQDKNRLQGLLKQPVFQSPYVILGPLMQQMDSSRNDLDDTIWTTIKQKKSVLDSICKQLQALRPSNQLAHFRHKLQQLEKALTHSMLVQLNHKKPLLKHKNQRLSQSWKAIFDHKKQKFNNLHTTLQAIDPKNLLTKGYCILFAEKDNSIITSVSSIEPQQDVKLLLGDGTVHATVKEVK